MTTLSNQTLYTAHSAAHSGAITDVLVTHSPRDRASELAINPNLAAAPSAAGDNYDHARATRDSKAKMCETDIGRDAFLGNTSLSRLRLSTTLPCMAAVGRALADRTSREWFRGGSLTISWLLAI